MAVFCARGNDLRDSMKAGSFLRDFRLTPRSRWEMRPSRLLRSVWRQFLTNVLGQPTGPIFKGQEVLILDS
jgi:hypothetical protein